LEYLPPYSPDLNPIEEGISCIKAWIRSNRDFVLGEPIVTVDTDPYGMIWNLVYNITLEKARGWIRHSGYL
ncbi:hypothetical protein BS17DRAFT_647263, partial [Gyrodon lividus]